MGSLMELDSVYLTPVFLWLQSMTVSLPSSTLSSLWPLLTQLRLLRLRLNSPPLMLPRRLLQLKPSLLRERGGRLTLPLLMDSVPTIPMDTQVTPTMDSTTEPTTELVSLTWDRWKLEVYLSLKGRQ